MTEQRPEGYRVRAQTPGVGDHLDPAEVDRPEPVMYAAKLGGLLSAFLVACGGVIALFTAGFGLDDLGPLGVAVGLVVTTGLALGVYLLQVWQGLKARAKVTPLVSPRNGDGVPLMEVPPEFRH